MIVEQVQILDRDHLFTRHRSKSSILCCVPHEKDRYCLIYPIAQYNFLLHIYNLPFESCFMCCSPIKTICNFGVVTLEAVLSGNGGLL